jgi:hypothetical protein
MDPDQGSYLEIFMDIEKKYYVVKEVESFNFRKYGTF